MSKNKRKKTVKVTNFPKQEEKKELKINEEKNSIFENILNTFILSAKFLLIFMSLVLIITSSLFLIKVEITKYHLPVIIIISIISFIILEKKQVKKSLLAIIIGLLVLISSTVLIGKIYDGTADGNTYHKLAVGALKNGWNPVYEDVADFHTNKGNPFDILEDNVNVKWVNHYANGTEQFAAVMYAATENIETGKVFNILWIYIGLFILCYLFKEMKINAFKSLMLASALTFNPIILTQIVNLYLDGVLAISLFIIIIASIIKTLYQKENINEINLILAMAIIWCVNAKFTGLAFAAIFSIILYLYRNIRTFIKEKDLFKEKLIKETLYYIVVVVLAVLIVGGSTYTKNLITHGHPLYPLYGKGHVENMVLKEMPISMQEYSSFKIFLIGIFSKGENVSPSYAEVQNDPDIKIPMTLTKEEIKNYNIPDIRVGGFGPLFSAIFVFSIISLIIIVIFLIKEKEYEKILVYGILILTTFTLVFALDGSYWARYIPYVYLLPIYSLIYLMKKEIKTNKLINIISFIIIGIFAINSGLILYTQYKHTTATNEYIKIRIDRLKEYYEENEEVTIQLNHHGLQGVQYNLDDLNIDEYELTDKEMENEGYMFKY